MNSLVIYDSKFGNTRMLAEAIGGKLELYGSARVLDVRSVGQKDLASVDLLVIGGPTQAHGLSPAMREFTGSLDVSPTAHTWAAAFDTRFRMATIITGSAARRITQLLERGGTKVIAPPESFFVTRSDTHLEPGELQRAVSWAAGLADRMAAKLQSVA